MATLRAIQSAANNQGSEAQMTWKALNSADAGMGSPNIDYDRFAARWETDPILKKLVDRFDANGLVIKTNTAKNCVMDRTLTEMRLKNVLASLPQDRKCKIHLLHGNMTDEEREKYMQEESRRDLRDLITN